MVQIIVVGAGEVGYEIAARLSRDNQNVVVIEKARPSGRVNNTLMSWLSRVRGQCPILEEAGVRRQNHLSL